MNISETVYEVQIQRNTNKDLNTSYILVSFRMTLTEVGKFNDTKHRAVSATAELLVRKALVAIVESVKQHTSVRLI